MTKKQYQRVHLSQPSVKQKWQHWLRQLLTSEEYAVYHYFVYYKDRDILSPATLMPAMERVKRLKTAMDKIQQYFDIILKMAQHPILHHYNKKHFLLAPLKDLDISKGIYQALYKKNVCNLTSVIALGIFGLNAIPGFGDKTVAALKSTLRYKSCEMLLK